MDADHVLPLVKLHEDEASVPSELLLGRLAIARTARTACCPASVGLGCSKNDHNMCPLRFVLIFLSAVLAAFFAFTSFGESSILDADEFPETTKAEEKKGLKRVCPSIQVSLTSSWSHKRLVNPTTMSYH